MPLQADGQLRVWFGKSDPRRSIPAWKVLQPDADLSDLAGKIVLVGASASLLSDIVATPIDPSTPGVEAHAQLIEQILSGVTLERPDWAPGAELLAGAAMSLIVAALLPFVPIYATTVVGGILAAAMALVSWNAFTRQGVLIDPLYPSIAAGFVFLAGVGQLYGQKRQQVNEIRSAFGRYVSPAVVARLAEHPEQLQLGGEKRDLTIMFCDIRSFTTLSEGFTAIELSAFLNAYLSPMTDIILGEEGTVDKYMGDAIMAFWNAPLDDAAHGIHAVRAALQMRETLTRLNQEWRAEAEAAGASLQAGEVRHRHEHRRMQRRQHGIRAAIRLFGARRRGQHRLAARGVVQAVRRRHRGELGHARRGAGIRLARDRRRQAQEQDAGRGALRARGRTGLRRERVVPRPPGAARGDARRLPRAEIRRRATIGRCRRRRSRPPRSSGSMATTSSGLPRSTPRRCPRAGRR